MCSLSSATEFVYEVTANVEMAMRERWFLLSLASLEDSDAAARVS